MRALSITVALTAGALVAGCNGKDVTLPGKTAALHVIIRHAASPDPTNLSGQPLGAFDVEVRSDTPMQEASETISWSGGDAVTSPETLANFHQTSDARAFVAAEGLQGQAVALGRALPFAMPEQGSVDAHVFLAVPEQLSGLFATPDPGWLRSGGAAVYLGNGQVLLVGGQSGGSLVAPALYDHTSGTVTTLSNGPLVRLPAVAALDGGGAIVAGGYDGTGSPTSAIWIYQGSGFTQLPVPLSQPVAGAVAAAFPDGEVAIVGGYSGTGASPRPATAQITVVDTSASPVVVATSPTALSVPRGEPAITPLQGVQPAFLISGGLASEAVDGGALASADLLQEGSGLNQLTVSAVPGPSGDASTSATCLGVGRYHHLAAPLSQGNVLLAGGLAGSTPLTSPQPFAYIYARGTAGEIVPLASGSGLPASVTGGAGIVLADGRTLITGGWGGAASAAGTVTLAGDPTTDATIAATYSTLAGASQGGGSLILLDDQSVIAAGGTMAFDAQGSAAATLGPQIFVPCIDADHPTCVIGSTSP